MQKEVYRICTRAEWREAESSGRYRGTDVDKKDGFIHLSDGAQVETTLKKHFEKGQDLLLVAIMETKLGGYLEREKSGDGQEYPHLYNDLLVNNAMWVKPIKVSPDGDYVLPRGIQV